MRKYHDILITDDSKWCVAFYILQLTHKHCIEENVQNFVHSTNICRCSNNINLCFLSIFWTQSRARALLVENGNTILRNEANSLKYNIQIYILAVSFTPADMQEQNYVLGLFYYLTTTFNYFTLEILFKYLYEGIRVNGDKPVGESKRRSPSLYLIFMHNYLQLIFSYFSFDFLSISHYLWLKHMKSNWILFSRLSIIFIVMKLVKIKCFVAIQVTAMQFIFNIPVWVKCWQAATLLFGMCAIVRTQTFIGSI